jgi:dihydrofolate synthase/folylpolyglutamate synthase
MNFRESVKYLYGLGNEVLAMKLGLESIRVLLGELGDPHLAYEKIQIAGTNGKGSTVAFIEAICVVAGIRVGATTSPHLVSVAERIRIGGRDISKIRFARLATRVREASEMLVARGKLGTVPTFFEQVTAIALLAFAETKVSLAILETGLGGRFDATTAAGAGLVAITRIDLDHQRILGETIEEIAAEKAAIIGDDRLVVIGEQNPAAMKVLAERCRATDSRPHLANEVRAVRDADGLRFITESRTVRISRLGLDGDHQIENAKVAILVAERLCLPTRAIEEGLETAVHRGRLERRDGVLLDGAHNRSGAAALRRYLDVKVPGAIVMVFAAMRDKDLGDIAEILFPRAATVIVTRAANPRSMDTLELAAIAGRFVGDVREAPNVADALSLARRLAPTGATVVVTGSLYLVGEALGHICESGDRVR